VNKGIATPFTNVNEGLAGATVFAGAAVFLQEPQKNFNWLSHGDGLLGCHFRDLSTHPLLGWVDRDSQKNHRSKNRKIENAKFATA